MENITEGNVTSTGVDVMSISANSSIQESKAETRRKVLDFIKTQGVTGATADEVAQAFASSHNHVAPRITELKAEGLVLSTKQRRTTRSGRSASVVIAV